MLPLANTPPPPYYAVIFTSLLSPESHGYGEIADRMVGLVAGQAGYLGHESAREGLGITVSYWKDLESIKAWKENAEHAEARKQGRDTFYSGFKVRICKVEKEYGFG